MIEKIFLLEAAVLFKDFMDELFYSYNEFKYTSIVLSFTKRIHELIIKVLTNSIKIIDNLFAKSEYRRKNFYLNKQNVNRTIVDCYGTLSFNRNYYTNKNNINNIPRQTVYNWIKQLIIPKVNYEPIETKETLYVMADEKWLHEQIN